MPKTQPRFVYRFKVDINCKDRKHKIKAETFCAYEEAGNYLLLKPYNNPPEYVIRLQDYQEMLDKNQITEIKQLIINNIDENYSPNHPFTFELQFKTDEHVKEFQATDMIISIIKSYLLKKRIGLK